MCWFGTPQRQEGYLLQYNTNFFQNIDKQAFEERNISKSEVSWFKFHLCAL